FLLIKGLQITNLNFLTQRELRVSQLPRRLCKQARPVSPTECNCQFYDTRCPGELRIAFNYFYVNVSFGFSSSSRSLCMEIVSCVRPRHITNRRTSVSASG
ncbi:hypothetical protein L9F63_007448, partial [Diploptera punctata]